MIFTQAQIKVGPQGGVRIGAWGTSDPYYNPDVKGNTRIELGSGVGQYVVFDNYYGDYLSLYPSHSGSISIGIPNKRWNHLHVRYINMEYVIGGTLVNSSDSFIKSNIKPLENGLAKLKN